MQGVEGSNPSSSTNHFLGILPEKIADSPLKSMKAFCLFLAVFVCSGFISSPAFARVDDASGAQNISFSDRVIGSTFKMLAKTFILAVDLEKLKKHNIAKLRAMDEQKFGRKYLPVYAVITQCPAFQARYGLGREISREQLIKKITALNKQGCFWIIDSIPDDVIASQFREYLAEKKQEIKGNNLLEQIQQVWNKIMRKV